MTSPDGVASSCHPHVFRWGDRSDSSAPHWVFVTRVTPVILGGVTALAPVALGCHPCHPCHPSKRHVQSRFWLQLGRIDEVQPLPAPIR